MSIQSEIERIKAAVSEAYAAVLEKGGEVPAEPNSGNLAAAIRSISGSGKPPQIVTVTIPATVTANTLRIAYTDANGELSMVSFRNSDLAVEAIGTVFLAVTCAALRYSIVTAANAVVTYTDSSPGSSLVKITPVSGVAAITVNISESRYSPI